MTIRGTGIAAALVAALAMPEARAAGADPWLLGVFDDCWAAVERGTLEPLDAYAPEMKVDGEAEQYWYATSKGPPGTVSLELVVRDGTVNSCIVRGWTDDGPDLPFEAAEPAIAVWRAALSETEGFHEIVPGRRVVEVARCPADGTAVGAIFGSTDHPTDPAAREAGSELAYPGNLMLGIGRIPDPGQNFRCGEGEQQ